MSRPCLVIVLLLTSAACRTTKLPPFGAQAQHLPAEEDEQQLWRDADGLEREIDGSGARYKNDQLEEYLQGVASKLLAAETGSTALPLRTKIIRNPLLNAFALPNGAIYMHTGMLARMDNEAQLASVLGHELTHFTHRHALKEMRSAQNKQAWLGALQLVFGVGGAAVGGSQLGTALAQLTGELAGLWALAAVRGYSRDLETEADVQGLRLLVDTGYDPNQAPAVFHHLQEDLGAEQGTEPFFFGTHPRLQERIDNYRRLLDTQYSAQAAEPGRRKNADEFLTAIGELPLDNAALDMEIGRLQIARAAIDHYLQRRPQSARGYFLAGETHRRLGRDEGHTSDAIRAYQQAARLDASYAEPHRELGLIYRSQHHPAEARAEFDRYLTLSPQAVDAPIIRGYRDALPRP